MKTLRIGLTGGIGSGKTVASNYFQTLGIAVIDTDLIARELVEPDQPALAEIVSAFGQDVLDDNGGLLRDQLRLHIHKNSSAKSRLEDILHPRIRNSVAEHLTQITTAYCIIVIPLLFETRYPIEVDRILVIDTDNVLQQQRVATRDQLSRDEIDAILANQLDRQSRLGKTDDVVVNTGTLGELYSQLDRLHDKYLSMIGGSDEFRGSTTLDPPYRPR
ncbi:MAG: dephospho-CoA kinase [Gammaproteobacteria bacterium]